MTLNHEEFTRRFEQHILPERFVKIRHGGYLAHNGKNKRIAAIQEQLNLPKPMPQITIPFSLQMLQRTGIDYSCCSKCKTGKMIIVASYHNHNGTLININNQNRSKTKNKLSPLKRALHKILNKSITKQKTKIKIYCCNFIRLGKGSYAKAKSILYNLQSVQAQNSIKVVAAALYKSYKTS